MTNLSLPTSPNPCRCRKDEEGGGEGAAVGVAEGKINLSGTEPRAETLEKSSLPFFAAGHCGLSWGKDSGVYSCLFLESIYFLHFSDLFYLSHVHREEHWGVYRAWALNQNPWIQIIALFLSSCVISGNSLNFPVTKSSLL